MVTDAGGVRRDIAGRIEGLGRELTHMAPREQMRALLAIKAQAQTHRLSAVASLAYALEGDLLAHGAEAPVHAYLDHMLDALDLAEDEQPRFVELALATLGAGFAFA
jgi:hypothetical protein